MLTSRPFSSHGETVSIIFSSPLSLCRRSVLLQPQRLHPHHLHLPVQRAQEGGDDGASQPAGLRSLPGGPAVAPVGAALPLHTGPHGDGRPVREDALAGQPEEHQLRGAGDHAGGRPAQIQHQVCKSKSSKQDNALEVVESHPQIVR